MKCLKSTKTGAIIRVTDKEAHNSTSEWKYIPKSEWKALRKPVSEKQSEEAEKKAETISEKALKRQKLKDKQRPAEDLDNRLMEK
jgi:hypothetical protein